jgi:hypothetical protein
MAFSGNDVGNGHWHCIVYRNEAIFGICVVPRMGRKAPGVDIQSGPREIVFSFFRFSKRFFVKQPQGVHLTFGRDPRAMIGDLLRTTYHMTYARFCILGMHAASGGVPSNLGETGRI